VKSKGGSLELRDPELNVIDTFKYDRQSPYHTLGIEPLTQKKNYFFPGTPGRSNSASQVFSRYLKMPVAGLPGGFYPGAVTVNLTASPSGVEIRYTLDGAEPRATSGTVYSTPLSFTTSTVVRARAFLAGAISSEIMTQT